MAGPRTWMLARELYLSGLTAGEVSQRLGVTVHAIRARIFREGWTKTAHADARIAPTLDALAAASEPATGGGAHAAEPEPAAAPLAPEALAQVVGRRAALALSQGRPAEAAALARAGEQVLAFLNALPPEPERDPDAVTAMWCSDVWRTAVRLADALLKDGAVPAVHARAAFRWRADNLGPEAAERDRRAAEAGGWSASVYDADGALLPPQTFGEFSAEVNMRGRTPI